MMACNSQAASCQTTWAMSADQTEARIAKLEAELAELKRAKSQAPPNLKGLGAVGPTTTQLAISRVGMSAEVVREMANAVGDGLVRQIVGGSAPATLKPLSEGSARPRVAQEDRSGWRNAAPLEPPGGRGTQDLIANLCEVQDARDRADLIAKEAQRLAKK
jgi:hypothetical protein